MSVSVKRGGGLFEDPPPVAFPNGTVVAYIKAWACGDSEWELVARDAAGLSSAPALVHLRVSSLPLFEVPTPRDPFILGGWVGGWVSE